MTSKTKYAVIIGIILTLICLLYGKIVLSSWVNQNGIYGYKKIVINSKENTNYFTLEDINNINKLLKTPIYTFYSEEKSINTEYSDIKVNGVFTNEYYKYFNFLNVKGTFLTDKLHNDRVVVISSDMALELFKSEDILGKNLLLFGENFKIIGVYKQKNNDNVNSTYTVFLPYQNIENTRDNKIYSTIEINNYIDNSISIKKIENVLSYLNFNIQNYNIVDFEKEYIKMQVIYSLPVIWIAILVLFIAIKYIIRKIRCFILQLNTELKRLYLMDIIKTYKKKILINICIITCCILIVCLFSYFIYYKYLLSKINHLNNYYPEILNILRGKYLLEFSHSKIYTDLIKTKLYLEITTLMGFVSTIIIICNLKNNYK